MPQHLPQSSGPVAIAVAPTGERQINFPGTAPFELVYDCFQLFKTQKCGWGVRCLDDIPQGQFICVYVGELLTGQQANEVGRKFGDEYFAELDFIETVEKAKKDYESDVEDAFDTSFPGTVIKTQFFFGLKSNFDLSCSL